MTSALDVLRWVLLSTHPSAITWASLPWLIAEACSGRGGLEMATLYVHTMALLAVRSRNMGGSADAWSVVNDVVRTLESAEGPRHNS
jgi:hypothetical protein